MERLTAQQLKAEFVLQNKLYNNLKKWLSAAMILSTLSLSAVLYLKNQPLIFWTALIVMALAIAAMLIIGLALKRGKNNLDKLILLMDQAA